MLSFSRKIGRKKTNERKKLHELLELLQENIISLISSEFSNYRYRLWAHIIRAIPIFISQLNSSVHIHLLNSLYHWLLCMYISLAKRTNENVCSTESVPKTLSFYFALICFSNFLFLLTLSSLY